MSPEYPVSASNFLRSAFSTAAAYLISVRCGAYRGFQRVKRVRVSVFGIGDGQRGRGCVAVAPVDSSAGAIDVKSQPEHGMGLIELDVFRQDSALFSCDAYTEVKIIREVRLVR